MADGERRQTQRESVTVTGGESHVGQRVSSIDLLHGIAVLAWLAQGRERQQEKKSKDDCCSSSGGGGCWRSSSVNCVVPHSLFSPRNSLIVSPCKAAEGACQESKQSGREGEGIDSLSPLSLADGCCSVSMQQSLALSRSLAIHLLFCVGCC